MSAITKEQLIEDLKASTQNSSGMFEISEDTICALMSMLTAPPAPVSVPEVVGWEDVPEEITEDDTALASAWAIGFNQCRAAMLQCADGSLAHEGKNHPEDKLGMVDHFGGSNNMVEPVTDNTNQQFESLSRGDK